MQIIMITENQKKELELAVEAVREFADVDELGLIIADNHSDDGTKEWANEQSDITYVYNDEEKMSFSKLINAVIKELKIDDDLLIMGCPYAVFPNTLSNIRKVLYYSEDTVIAGGRSPAFSSNQCITDLDNDFEKLFKFAVENNADHSFEVMTQCGNVLMIRKDYLNSGALFDERIIGVEDAINDYCISALVNNKKIRVAMYSLFWNPTYAYLGDSHTNYWALDCEVMMDKWNMRYFNLLGNGSIAMLIDNKVTDKINVLEIGCDCGGTLVLIKSLYPNVALYGTDICEPAVNIAKHVVKVCINNIEEQNIPFTDVKFDYIIFGDVLEHLRDPLAAIKYCRELLKDDGCILASIPNFTNVYVMSELLHGNFTYTETGLLDRTHIHMFTYKEILRMFANANYTVQKITSVHSDITPEADKLIDSLMALGDGVERHMYTTFQYLVKAQKSDQ